MKNNPICPYCGREMEYYFDDNPMQPQGCYYCNGCGAHGPTAQTKRAAYAATMYMNFHEMTAREFLKTEARMCKYYGMLSVFDLPGFTVDEAIKMVEQFGKEHPERSDN